MTGMISNDEHEGETQVNFLYVFVAISRGTFLFALLAEYKTINSTSSICSMVKYLY